jgi:UDP-N-acetylglucosamine:LPS N-acetylglucosamine transferase
MKICFASSSGGHLYALMQLNGWWRNCERFWITDPHTIQLKMLENEIVYFGHFPDNRNFVNAVRNLGVAITLFRKNRPDVVVSAGAGIAVPILLVAKLMGIPTIYIEFFNFASRQTLSGKLVRWWVDDYVVQNEALAAQLGKQYYGGAL